MSARYRLRFPCSSYGTPHCRPTLQWATHPCRMQQACPYSSAQMGLSYPTLSHPKAANRYYLSHIRARGIRAVAHTVVTKRVATAFIGLRALRWHIRAQTFL